MSKQEMEMKGAMRIFEALSGVDEELLIRCEEKTKKTVPFWYYGKVLAACLCFVVMGALLWSVRPVMDMASKSSGGVDMAAPAAAQEPESAMETMMEEAACENEALPESAAGQSGTKMERDENTGYDKGENGNVNDSLTDLTGNVAGSQVEDGEVAETESIKQESAKMEVTQQGAPLDNRKVLSLEEAKTVSVLGEYVPTVIPAGYTFENARLAEQSISGEAERLSLCWVNGMDDIQITISYATEDIVTVDVDKTETYDVHLYEIPYASTVPQEYRTVFNNPVFAAEDFALDIVEMRMKTMADAGDTATPRGNFGVLYDNNVLVEFNGHGDAESIYAMMISHK